MKRFRKINKPKPPKTIDFIAFILTFCLCRFSLQSPNGVTSGMDGRKPWGITIVRRGFHHCEKTEEGREKS